MGKRAYISDGNNNWIPLVSSLPNMSAYATKDYVDIAIDNIDALPAQTGNEGKFLTTDGALASWADVNLSEYLSLESASSTYLTQANASSTYLTQTDASEQYEKLIPYSSSSVVNAEVGDLWIDSTASASPLLKTYTGSEWVQLGGSDNVFVRLNLQTIDENYTMPSGYNGVTAGPITISDGVIVTIPDGSAWSIV